MFNGFFTSSVQARSFYTLLTSRKHAKNSIDITLPCFATLMMLAWATNYEVLYCVIFFVTLFHLGSKYSLLVSAYLRPCNTEINTNAKPKVKLKFHTSLVKFLGFQLSDENVKYSERHYPFKDETK
jgi:hypothetical protein